VTPLCAPKQFGEDGGYDVVDIAPEIMVKTSTERENMFHRFMIEDVLSVKEKDRLPEYTSLVAMKDAYKNIRKALVPDLEEDSSPACD
jgi:hypothetical protein